MSTNSPYQRRPEDPGTVIRSIWTKGWEALRTSSRETVIIATLGMALPQMAASLYFAASSQATVSSIRSQVNDPNSEQLLSLLGSESFGFLGEYLSVWLVVWCLFFVSYLSLVALSGRYLQGQPMLSLPDALKVGLQSLPRMLVALIVVILLTILGQFLLAPAVLIAVLALMIPVLIVSEGRGALAALGHSFTLRYARREQGGLWSTLINLLTFGCLYYAACAFGVMGIRSLAHLDEIIEVSRTLWVTNGTPFAMGPMQILAVVLEVGLVASLSAILPAMTSSLYFLSRQGRITAEA